MDLKNNNQEEEPTAKIMSPSHSYSSLCSYLYSNSKYKTTTQTSKSSLDVLANDDLSKKLAIMREPSQLKTAFVCHENVSSKMNTRRISRQVKHEEDAKLDSLKWCSLASSSKLSSRFNRAHTTLANERGQRIVGSRHLSRFVGNFCTIRKQTTTTTLERNYGGSPLLVCSLFLLLSVAMATLIQVAGAIKLQPEGREKFYWSGEQFVITCQNSNNIKNVRIRWIGPNGLGIPDDRTQRVHTESTGHHGQRLVVMNATVGQDDGQYKCTLASVGGGDDKHSREQIEFNLKISKLTSFKDTVRHLVLPINKPGQIECKVEFDPGASSATVFWFKDKIPIDNFNKSEYTASEYNPDRQSSLLTLPIVTRKHDGIYTCRTTAETAHLSRILDHDIELETQYAPSFDKRDEIYWVEKSQSVLSRQKQRQLHQQTNQYGVSRSNSIHSQSSTSGSRSRHNKPTSVHNVGPHYMPNRTPQSASESSMGTSALKQDEQLANTSVVRIELVCTCLANPPTTSMLWYSDSFVLAKGNVNADHILEEIRVERDGHNTTSILVIGYNLDPNWPHRNDKYSCLAENPLGKDHKSFTIEQGDPPPAFNVGPDKQYNPQTSLFNFKVIGVSFDPEGSGATTTDQALIAELRPPVDGFRIRAESPVPNEPKSTSYWSQKQHKQIEHSVQWSLTADTTYSRESSQDLSSLQFPRNFTVKLAALPSGNQKLYLEAHNAVGWSPNATYLGDYYIVSGVSSFISVHQHLFSWLLIVLMVTSWSALQTFTKRQL